jgi:hypothetical protein
MARNGSGTYTNPYPNFVSGTVISSTEVDTNNSQIATALTQSIAVDGQSVVTQDIPLATHKFTAMKDGNALTDSLSLGQAQAEAFVWCGTAGGSADAITLSPSPGITAYAAGQRFVWMASASTNTTATTVAISGLTPIALQDNGVALTAGQHAAGKMFMAILNTTSTAQLMQVQVSGTDPLIVTSLTVSGTASFEGDATYAAGADIITASLGANNVRIGAAAGDSIILGGDDNVVVGTNAGTAITTGAGNIAVGSLALAANTTADHNIAVGYSTLGANTTGAYNIAVGGTALGVNTTGATNVAVGYAALGANTTGSPNVAVGYGALAANTTGAANVAVGYAALGANTTADNNAAIGYGALVANTTGGSNIAVGGGALAANTTGSPNVAVGYAALGANTTGTNNAAIGYAALDANTTGVYNISLGTGALGANTTASYNVAIGGAALGANTTGASNTAVGHAALYYNTTGSGNTMLGPLNSAGAYAPTFSPTVEDNRFCMGSTSVTNAYIKVAWTVTSDARDKTNFAPVPHGLDFVQQLQPTAYQFRVDRETDVTTGIVRYGFKAQDVLELEGDNPVIVDNEDDSHLRLNESSLIPILVNAIQELSAEVTALTARLAILEG